VIERRQPLWSIARLQHFVHRDKSDLEIAKELSEMPELGAECKDMFKQRILEANTKATETVTHWADYAVTSKTAETPRVVRLELTAINIPEAGSKAFPAGSYALLKLTNGLQRAYSIVSGNTSSFMLSIALDDKSRGVPCTLTNTLISVLSPRSERLHVVSSPMVWPHTISSSLEASESQLSSPR
jgi:hypothetical protein